MQPIRRATLELHIAVLLFGFTAILGRLIELNAIMLVWWRVLFTCLSLLFFVKVSTLLKQMSRGMFIRFMGIGWLVAAHWLCFYGSIKESNASIALICLSFISLFTALIEPLILRQKIKGLELMVGALVIPGMILIVQHLDLAMLHGIWLGILAALFGTLFSVFNKKYIDRTHPLNITFIELGSATILLSLVVLFLVIGQPDVKFWPNATDLGYLLVLALLCTTLAYVLSLRSLKYLSAFAANLTINLEPVYGIILAILLLHENKELSIQFYMGVFLILIVVFAYPILKKRISRISPAPDESLGTHG
ncbi:MAG: DMT family transporter [Saprospiraceae bacterium]